MKTATVQDVIEFVAQRYTGVYRRDGKTPYFTHLERVAKNVDDTALGYFGQEIVVKAAYLHDILEDGLANRTDLMKLGVQPEVIAMVESLTKDKYDDYLYYIREVKSNHRARMVKIADILDNLSDAPTEKQIIKYAQALLILYGVIE